MNYDLIKSTLLEIMKEAQNLPDSELEYVPSTQVKVKKGRTKEFDVNAYYYCEYINNVKITDDIDYVSVVFDMLSKELLEEKDEFSISKAQELVSASRGDMASFKELMKEYAALGVRYQSCIDSLNKLYSDRSNPNFQEKLDDLNNRIKANALEQDRLTRDIIEIKQKVNGALLNSIEEQLKWIRGRYTSALKGTTIAAAVDKNMILATDLDEYNSLYLLAQILRVAIQKNDIKDLVNVDNVMCITKEQKEVVERLLPRIAMFKYIEEPERKANKELILKIQDRMNEITSLKSRKNAKGRVALNGVKVPEANFDEYNDLIEMLKILNRANNSDLNLVSVWDIAYVVSTDRDKLESLLKNSAFKDLDGSKKKLEENEKKIAELEAYLALLEDKFNRNNKVTNVAAAMTDNDTIVLAEDRDEYNNILQIIDILRDVNTNAIGVWGLGNVKYENASKFKRLVNETRFYEKRRPNAQVNNKEIDNIDKRLAELREKARNAQNLEVTNNGVLASDEPEYKALMAKKEALDASKNSTELVPVGDVKLDESQINKYTEAEKELESIKNAPAMNISGASQSKPVVEEEQALDEDADKIEEEEQTINNSGNVKPEEQENKSKRMPVKIRKLPGSKLDFFKKNRKLILAVGIGATLAALALPNVIPAIIFANSCNAAALPWASGFFNAITAGLAKIGGIQFVNGAWITASGEILNLGASASAMLAANLESLANLGIISSSFIVAKSVAKQDDIVKLPDPERKSIAGKILDLSDKIKYFARDKYITANRVLDGPVSSIEERAEKIKNSIKDRFTAEDDYEEEYDYDEEYEDAIDEEVKPTLKDKLSDLGGRIGEKLGDVFFEDVEEIEESTRSDADTKEEDIPEVEAPSVEEAPEQEELFDDIVGNIGKRIMEEDKDLVPDAPMPPLEFEVGKRLAPEVSTDVKAADAPAPVVKEEIIPEAIPEVVVEPEPEVDVVPDMPVAPILGEDFSIPGVEAPEVKSRSSRAARAARAGRRVAPGPVTEETSGGKRLAVPDVGEQIGLDELMGTDAAKELNAAKDDILARAQRIEEETAEKEPEAPAIDMSNITDTVAQAITQVQVNNILNQIDMYVLSVQQGMDGSMFRVEVLKATGIDLLEDYDLLLPESVNEAKEDVKKTLNLGEEALIAKLESKINDLQDSIDEGIIPERMKAQYVEFVDMLNKRIEELKNERGRGI